MAARTTAILLLAAFAAALAAAQPPASPAPAASPAPGGAAPDLSNVPEACINSGTELQSSCAAEFSAADAAFGGAGSAAASGGSAPPSITQAQIDAYIKQAPAPSADCCVAAKKFNDARCSCDAAVLGLAAQFLGGSTAAYTSVAKGFADACKYPALIGGTC